MADRNYTITLKYEGKTENAAPVAGEESQSSAVAMQSGIVKGLVAYKSLVKTFVQPMVDHYIQTIDLRTGASEQQQRAQFAYEMIQQGVGIGTSILTGFLVGNAPGALVGAVIGVASAAIGYANKADTIRMQSDLESITLSGYSRRAGGYAPTYSASRSNKQ